MKKSGVALLGMAVMGGAVAACNEGSTFIPFTGTLEVVAASTGSAIDPNGYSITLDEEEVSTIGANDTVSLVVDVGDRALGLTGWDDPCVVQGENPVTVTIERDQAHAVTFDVLCEQP